MVTQGGCRKGFFFRRVHEIQRPPIPFGAHPHPQFLQLLRISGYHDRAVYLYYFCCTFSRVVLILRILCAFQRENQVPPSILASNYHIFTFDIQGECQWVLLGRTAVYACHPRGVPVGFSGWDCRVRSSSTVECQRIKDGAIYHQAKVQFLLH